jgi:hypothetical protein
MMTRILLLIFSSFVIGVHAQTSFFDGTDSQTEQLMKDANQRIEKIRKDDFVDRKSLFRRLGHSP